MKKVILFLLLASLTLSGCGSKEKENEESIITGTVGEMIDEMDTGEIVLSMRTTSTLNPLLNEDASVDSILRIMYMPVIDLDETGKPSPSIAESWYYSEEGTVLNVKIKEGILWHDGSEVTADDIIYSVGVLKEAGENAVYKECVENITECVKNGKYSLEVHFDEAYSGNVYSMCFLPVNKNWAMRSGDKVDALGNGSYAFESYTPAKEIVLKAAENTSAQKPYTQTVRVRMTTDSDTDIYSFSQRLTDCINVKESEMGRFDIGSGANKYSYVSNYYDFIGFNFDNSILRERNVRKAIAYAVPLESIIEGVYLSNAVAASTPVSPASYLYDETVKTYDYSLDASKDYFEASGFTVGAESDIRERYENEEPQKLSFRLLVNEESEERKQAARKIAEELKASGCEIIIEKVPFDEYVKKLEKGDFDMFMGGWEMSVMPYPGFMFDSAHIGKTNYISYNSEKMDSLLAETYTEVANSAILENYSAIQHEIAEELPYVSLVYRKSAIFTDEMISGDIMPYKDNCYKTIAQWKTERR